MCVTAFDESAARSVVKRALKLVADFDDRAPIDDFVFDRFMAFHKKVFLDGLRTYVNAAPCADNGYHDVLPTPSDLDGKTVGQLIVWLLSPNVVGIVDEPDTHTLSQQELEGAAG